MLVLALAQDVRILEPASLREMVRQKAAVLAGLYNSSAAS